MLRGSLLSKTGLGCCFQGREPWLGHGPGLAATRVWGPRVWGVGASALGFVGSWVFGQRWQNSV